MELREEIASILGVDPKSRVVTRLLDLVKREVQKTREDYEGYLGFLALEESSK